MRSVRFCELALLTACCAEGVAWGDVVHLGAIESTSRYVSDTTYYWTSDTLAAQSSYASLDGHLSVSYGYVKFDLSPIPTDAEITSLTLSATVQDVRTDNPGENSPPSISVFRVGDDGWVRGGNTFIPLGERLSLPQMSYASWSLDVGAVDWSADLLDGQLSLAFTNETTPAFHPNMYIYNWAFLYGSDTSFRPVLHVTYVPEPSALLTMGSLWILVARARRASGF